MPLDRVPETLGAIRRVAPELDTVISLDINGRCGPNGEVMYEDLVAEAGFTMRPNGKTNLGMARMIEPKETTQVTAD
jgi:hypothetical protein